jgi:Glycosyl hydrolases family 18
MRPQTRVRTVLVAVASAGFVAIGTGTAHAAGTPLPAHVFAPYFEAYNGDNPVTLSQQSGAKYLTFAFIQTASAGSCTAYWNGDTGEPLTSASFGNNIKTIQSNGGNVVPSFGGYTADTTGTDIADSCTSVSSIAKVYEKVISTYNVSRIDLDIEENSLTNTAGINRRNRAVAQTESWAAANGRSIQFSYTLPATPAGMDSSDKAVIQNAIADGAKVSVVNLMTFDYYVGTNQEMATDTETAASGLHSQLQSLYPSDTSAQLWAMIGVTEMPGIDDYGTGETFTEADATTVLNWAKSHGIGTLSFWALQRDNGGCPGTGGSDSCSGISQPDWYFSHTFESFTGKSG